MTQPIDPTHPPTAGATENQTEIEDPGPPPPLAPPPAPIAPPPPAASAVKRAILLAIAAILALTAIATVAVFLKQRKPPVAATRSIGARLDLAAGDVLVTEQGAAAVTALSGEPLASDSHVATSKGARALVRTGDGASVFLRGETEIALFDHGIELVKGEVWLDAPRVSGAAFECRLGKHVASASDAGLSIARQGDDVTVYVARGLSILTSPGGRIEINSGEQGTSHADGKPPALAPVAFWQDWTGGMADSRPVRGAAGSGSGRIYGLDPSAGPGSPARKLGIAKESVHAVLRDGLAETEVDQTFSNPGSQAIEGWYWFTIPPEATVTSFALETNGVLVEGEIVEKREAAARYTAALRQAKDPALLEWIDGRSYRARIFPIPASGTRRVVLRYTELLPTVEGKIRYVYPLRSDDPVRFDEFALTTDLGPDGATMQVATSLDATLEPGGRLVTMRRSGYLPQADFQLEMTGGKPKSPVRAWRFAAGSDQADYVMLRYVPEIDFTKLPPQKGALVVVVDTSAGGDESARQLRTSAAEAILRALSDDDRFALVAVDVAPKVLYPDQGLEAATDANIAKALERLSEHAMGGASDLGSMFEPALERLHGAEQPAIAYVGDGVATSGETTSDGLLDRLRRSLSGSRARFFAVGVGNDARHELLEQLTRAGGGQYVRIDEADQTMGQALRLTTLIKTPTMTDLDVDLGAGLDQPFYSATGKLSRGEELVLLARTHHALPPKVVVKGRAGGKEFKTEYPLSLESSITTSLVPRLWAAEYVRRLIGSGASPDDNRAKVLDLGMEYGLMTPYTSILALDSEQAYARQGIPRRASPLRGVRLTMLGDDDARERAIGAMFSGTPQALGGCSKSDAPESASESAPRGGTGTRAKGEEGVMGSPASPTAATTQQFAATDNATSPEDLLTASDDSSPSSPPGAAAATATAAMAPPPPIAGLGVVGGGGQAGAKPATVSLPIARGADVGVNGAQPPAEPASGRHAGGNGTNQAVKKSPPDPSLDGERKQNAGEPHRERSPITASIPPKKPLGQCSDASSRPLFERIVMWRKRLTRVTQASDLVTQYDGARAACELPDWRDQSALLDLIQQRIETEQAAQLFLGYLAGESDAQSFVARGILRRTVDTRLASAVSSVLFGGRVDWAKVDRELLDIDKPDAREQHLRAAMLIAPGDPQGDVRLVRLLAQIGKRDDAISYGRRLRERGLLTPTLAQQLGDALSDANESDEALRTYSDVVEFDPNDPAARRVLGDVFLRQGWYEAAYRQYKTLTDLDAKGAASWLRLADAAAGAGRVDEAFRIEREVANGEGSPGPNDPRYWARLWSADRLGVLLNDPSKAGGADAIDGIGRRLKQLQLFTGPGTLALLTWEDLDGRLELVTTDDKKETLTGEANDAGATGLFAVFVPTDTWTDTAWSVRWKGDAHGRAVKFQIASLGWDGKSFTVGVKRGELKPDVRDVRAPLSP